MGVNDFVETLPVIASDATKFPPSIAICFFSGRTSITLPSDDTLVTFSPSRNLFVTSLVELFFATMSVEELAIAYWPGYFFSIYLSNVCWSLCQS